METILEEIIVHFRPEPEEELHSAVHALLIKCYQVCMVAALDALSVSRLKPLILGGTLNLLSGLWRSAFSSLLNAHLSLYGTAVPFLCQECCTLFLPLRWKRLAR